MNGKKKVLRLDNLTHVPEISQLQRNTIARPQSPDLCNALVRRQNTSLDNGHLAFRADLGHKGGPAGAFGIFSRDGGLEEREGEFGEEVLEQAGFLGGGELAGREGGEGDGYVSCVAGCVDGVDEEVERFLGG